MTDGPELELEQILAPRLATMLGCDQDRSWLGGSLPLGSGAPDIVLAQWQPEIVSLSPHKGEALRLLGYLRGVSRARSETIADRLRKNVRLIEKRLDALEADAIVQRSSVSYQLASPWRSVLTEVVTVEVKVKDWRRAVLQAARNCIFSHQSYVAMPMVVAERLRCQTIVQELGLGVISIDDTDAKVIKRPRRRQPRVWSYYYQMANVVASELAGNRRALRSVH